MNHLPFHSYMTVVALAACLVGCGGGGSSGSSNEGSGASPSTYTAATPVVGSSRVYSISTIDNSQNTINETAKDTIDSVNADGSFQSTETDPNNNSVTVGGTVYSVGTTISTHNASHQTLTTVHSSSSGGSTTTCTFSPYSGGAPNPFFVGETWTTQYSETCGTTAPTSYTHSGQVMGLESVTIPGVGTFSTAKIQSTLVWTNSAGTTTTETITNWRDTGSGFSVKQVSSFSRTGTVPTNGYAISRTSVLKSMSSGS